MTPSFYCTDAGANSLDARAQALKPRNPRWRTLCPSHRPKCRPPRPWPPRTEGPPAASKCGSWSCVALLLGQPPSPAARAVSASPNLPRSSAGEGPLFPDGPSYGAPGSTPTLSGSMGPSFPQQAPPLVPPQGAQSLMGGSAATLPGGRPPSPAVRSVLWSPAFNPEFRWGVTRT